MGIVGNSKFTQLESFITPNAVVLHLISKFGFSAEFTVRSDVSGSLNKMVM